MPAQNRSYGSSTVDIHPEGVTTTLSNRAMAEKVGCSHQLLRRHVRRGIVRADDEAGGGMADTYV